MAVNDQRGCILVARNDGLGARLLPIVSALRLALAYQVPVKIHWPLGSDTTFHISQYAELFDQRFIDRYFIAKDEYFSLSARARPFAEIESATAEAMADRVRSGQVYSLDITTHKVILAGEDQETVAAGYRAAMQSIKFTQIVTGAMRKIDQITGQTGSTAYHIRHGDITQKYRTWGSIWRNKFIPCEIYLEHMRQHEAGHSGPVFLFGDLQASLAWLKNHRPEISLLCRASTTLSGSDNHVGRFFEPL